MALPLRQPGAFMILVLVGAGAATGDAEGCDAPGAFEAGCESASLLQSHMATASSRLSSPTSAVVGLHEASVQSNLNAAKAVVEYMSLLSMGPLGPVALLVSLLVPLVLGSRFPGLSKYVAEYLGTFVLTFTVSCVVLAGTAVWNALAIACALMVMVYATGPISGGNLNPAVTLALGLTGGLPGEDVLKYWVSQIVAGLAAAVSADAIFGGTAVLTLGPVAPFHIGHALAAETLFTFVLCFVVLNCALSRRNNSPTDSNQFFGLAIGFVIVVGGYAAGSISGAALNPAVAVGLDYRKAAGGWAGAYAVCEMLGAVLAVGLYYVVRPEEQASSEGAASGSPPLAAKCASELIGTFVLATTVGLNIVTGSPAVALSAGAALMVMVYSLGNVSGAHLNPAVTLAAVTRGACSAKDGGAYIVSQIVAALLAGLTTAFFHASSARSSVTISVGPGTGYDILQGSIAELVFTFVLAYTVLAVATAKPLRSQTTQQNFYFGLAIASCVVAGGNAVGAISGGELNPAVGLGLAVAGGVSRGTQAGAPLEALACFCLAECFGGILAAVAFFLTHAQDRTEGVGKEWVCLLAEFLGTFVLVFTVACCVLTNAGLWSATAIACVLLAMIYATGPVSGANLNPAVSFALALSALNDGFRWMKAIGYIVAQIVGGMCAGSMASLLIGKKLTLQPVAPFEAQHAVSAEAIYTFLLCFAVLNCAASRTNNPPDDGNQSFGLAIGFTIVAGGYAVGGISGAALNPAVALGLDAQKFGTGWAAAWAVGEIAGAALAVLLFRMVRPEEGPGAEAMQRYVSAPVTKLVSEFLGTFILVLTVVLNVVTGSAATAWSVAASLMCMVYSLGSVSGAHFNPAVTLALWLGGRNKCGANEAVPYVVVQSVAGVFAGLVGIAFHNAGPEKGTEFPVQPGKLVDTMGAGVVEMFFTGLLAYVVLAVATTRPPKTQPNTRQSFPFALAIGSCITAGGLAAGPASGGMLNPAVALGLAAQSRSLDFVPFFIIWQFASSCWAAVALRATHPAEFEAEAKAGVASSEM